MSKEYVIAKDGQDWLEIRKQGIGGSDVGSIMGVNQYRSPFEVWAEKTGQIEAVDISENIPIIIGNELEETVARLFEKETGLKVRKDNKTHFHQKYPFLLANIDRQIVGKKALLECKTTSVFNRKQWIDDEIPASYLLQVQHYLDVLDYEVGYIAVLIGNTDFVWKEIKRDDKLIQIMHDKLIPFWEVNVLKNIAPNIDGSKASSEFIKTKYHDELSSFDEVGMMSNKQVAYVATIKDYEKMIKDLTAKKDEISNRIKLYMGENQFNQLVSEMFSVTWKTQERTTVDSKLLKKEYPEIYKKVTKTSSSTVFRIKENK